MSASNTLGLYQESRLQPPTFQKLNRPVWTTPSAKECSKLLYHDQVEGQIVNNQSHRNHSISTKDWQYQGRQHDFNPARDMDEDHADLNNSLEQARRRIEELEEQRSEDEDGRKGDRAALERERERSRQLEDLLSEQRNTIERYRYELAEKQSQLQRMQEQSRNAGFGFGFSGN